MATRKRDLGPTERAVYALVEAGKVDALHAPLYRRPLGALAAHGLVSRNAHGGYTAIVATTPALLEVGARVASPALAAALEATPDPIAPAPPPPPPPPEPMVTIVARVPERVAVELRAQSDGNLSEATRAALARGLMRRAHARPNGAAPHA